MLIDSSQEKCSLATFFLLLFWFWISQYCEESNEKPAQSTKFHPRGCQLDGCCRLSAHKVLYTVHVQLRLQILIHATTPFIPLASCQSMKLTLLKTEREFFF